MSDFDSSKYTIIVKKQVIDDKLQFLAQALEFPLLYICADSAEEAYSNAIETINEFYEDSIEDGDSLPEPIELSDEYTGRVTLRMPKSLHKQVDLLSKIDGASLNQFIVNAISLRVAGKQHEFQIQKLIDNLASFGRFSGLTPMIGLGAPSLFANFNILYDKTEINEVIKGNAVTSITPSFAHLLPVK
jgi:predicted HicB family RNase H-like nuclease